MIAVCDRRTVSRTCTELAETRIDRFIENRLAHSSAGCSRRGREIRKEIFKFRVLPASSFGDARERSNATKEKASPPGAFLI